MNPSAPAESGWIAIDLWGMVAVSRVVAIGMASSAPIRRLLNATSPAHVLVLTGGQRRQAVLILDSGHLVITPLSLDEVAAILKSGY